MIAQNLILVQVYIRIRNNLPGRTGIVPPFAARTVKKGEKRTMRLTAYLTYLTGILHLAVMRILRAVPSACQGAEMCVVRNVADSVRAERLILREPKRRYAGG